MRFSRLLAPTATLAFVMVSGPVLAASPSGTSAPEMPPVWRQKCSSCHGSGQGNTGMGKALGVPDFSSPEFQKTRTDTQLRTTILEGSTRNRSMRGYKDSLDEAQLKTLIGFIRSLNPGASKAAAPAPAKAKAGAK